MPRALDVYVFGTTRTHSKSPLSGLGGIPNNSPQIGGGVDPLNWVPELAVPREQFTGSYIQPAVSLSSANCLLQFSDQVPSL